jgi:hypothetical protein
MILRFAASVKIFAMFLHKMASSGGRDGIACRSLALAMFK